MCVGALRSGSEGFPLGSHLLAPTSCYVLTAARGSSIRPGVVSAVPVLCGVQLMHPPSFDAPDCQEKVAVLALLCSPSVALLVVVLCQVEQGATVGKTSTRESHTLDGSEPELYTAYTVLFCQGVVSCVSTLRSSTMLCEPGYLHDVRNSGYYQTQLRGYLGDH